MMKRKQIMLLLMAIVFFSCGDNRKEQLDDEPYYVAVTDSSLIREIMIYQDKMRHEFVRDVSKGDSVYVMVYCKTLNDSTTQYVLNPFDYSSCSHWWVIPFHFICKVNGHPVFFRMATGEYRSEEHHIFEISDESFDHFFAKYFPRRYPSYKKLGYITPIRICGPEMCYLTYVRDSLVNVRHGY